jgi:UDP-N-acetylglucosamine 2-epimerase
MGLNDIDLDTLKVAEALNEWSKKKVHRGKSFRELFTYDEASIWWFLYWLVRGSKYIPCSMQEALEAERIGRGDVLKNNLWWRVFRSKRNLELMNLRFWARRALEKGTNYTAETPKKSARPRVLVLGKNIDVRRMKDPDTGRDIRANVYLEPIIRALERSDLDVVRVERRYGIGGKERRNSKGWNVFEKYEPTMWNRQIREKSKFLKAFWKETRPYFEGSFIVDGKDLSSYLISSLDIMFEKRIPQVIRLIEGMKNMLRAEKPDAVLFLSDTKDTERALVIAARGLNIPVLGLAHAGFNRFSYSYQYEEGDIPADLSIRAPFAVVPDRLMVYGPKHKRSLVSWNWPTEIVKVTGQPRYDALNKVGDFYDKEKIRKDLKISPNKKFVLMTTQSHGLSLKVHELTVRESYRMARELSDEIDLRIKLHPNERKDRVKIDMYRDIGIEEGFEPYILQDEDTVGLIYSSDILMQNHSTTAIEAILMDKPVISMNFTDGDLLGIVGKGASLEVKSQGELSDAVKSILQNNQVNKRLKAGRKKVIYDFTYKSDGKASDRVCECVKAMIGKHPKISRDPQGV